MRAVAEPRRLLGLCSGTSADALDLALVEVRGRGPDRTVRFLAGAVRPLPTALRARILEEQSGGAARLAQLHFAIGDWFGREARRFLQELAVRPGELAAAGSHGQTVFHHDGDPAGGTLQLGDAALIAAHLQTPVVADFRWSDLAAGGQGAPISPFADHVLHRGHAPQLGILNLGGIANLTLLRGDEPPLAWDSGPANGPLDALMRQERDQSHDQGGALAAQGSCDPALLAELQGDPFFARLLPRSTGLERFGAPLARRLRLARPRLPLADLLATAAELAAWAVADSLARSPWRAGSSLYLAGGGARNPVLVAALERRLQGKAVLRSYRELGWQPETREAVAFALLADAYLCGEPSTWPTTTGARRPALLGRWTPPPFLDQD